MRENKKITYISSDDRFYVKYYYLLNTSTIIMLFVKFVIYYFFSRFFYFENFISANKQVQLVICSKIGKEIIRSTLKRHCHHITDDINQLGIIDSA